MEPSSAAAASYSSKKKKKEMISLQNTTKIVLLLTLGLILLIIIPLYYPMIKPLFIFTFSSSSSSSLSLSTSSLSSSSSSDMEIVRECDIFSGEWVRNPEGPYYNTTTCWAIHDHQNCMKFGRPDDDFMRWRWKPDECEMRVFDPWEFLEIVRGKSMAFVGDSVGRNQMQSLICLLSRVSYPKDVSYTADDGFKRWLYKDYNFTLACFWSPFLVKAKEADPISPALAELFHLHLDEFDEDWTAQVDEFDYIIISAGHWFFRSSLFHEGGRVVGCHYCKDEAIPDRTFYYSYRKAFKTAFKAINALDGFKGVTFLRTYAPAHFENGEWNKGGNCVRRRPFLSNETTLDGMNMEMYMTQLEEFRAGEREGREKGRRFRLLDVTQAMLLRPDGHPSRYGHWAHENATYNNDCLHWCLPGPIDVWNDFLLEMLKMEGSSSLLRQAKLFKSEKKLKFRR